MNFWVSGLSFMQRLWGFGLRVQLFKALKVRALAVLILQCMS